VEIKPTQWRLKTQLTVARGDGEWFPVLKWRRRRRVLVKEKKEASVVFFFHSVKMVSSV
jgi:hypothetical protein